MGEIEDVLTLIKQRGHRITPQRRLIISDVLGHGSAVSAQAVLNRVTKEQPDISMDTVYRNLYLLCELGVLYRLELPGKASEFELQWGRHRHYRICLACGERKSIDVCCIDQACFSGIEDDGFTMTDHKLEFYGYCRRCQEQRRIKSGQDKRES